MWSRACGKATQAQNGCHPRVIRECVIPDGEYRQTIPRNLEFTHASQTA